MSTNPPATNRHQTNSAEPEEILADYNNFPQHFASLLLATVSSEGNPYASYAPFVIDADKNIYIFASDLATHTSHLKTTGKASVLLIEDETKSQNIFGRKRLTFDCQATLIDKNTPQWNKTSARFQERFGQIIDILRNLSDFHIFQLTPKEGLFVSGFGAIYKVSGDRLNTLTPFRGGGHKSR